VDINRISLGGKIVAIAGLLFFIDSFLPWFRECIDIFGQKTCISGSAWHTIFSILATLLVIALVAEVLYTEGTGATLSPLGSVTWDQIRLGAGIAVPVLVLLQLLIGYQGIGRGWAMFLGLILGAAIAYGEFARTRTPATTPPPAYPPTY